MQRREYTPSGATLQSPSWPQASCARSAEGIAAARLRFNVGPGGQAVIPIEVDYSHGFGPSDHQAWEAEYRANIKPDTWLSSFGAAGGFSVGRDAGDSTADEWLDAFEAMAPDDRRFVIDELAARPELWDESEMTPW
jgi:hypothetical protein